jgi:nitrogen fixation protein NifU and related proteins
MQYSDKVLEHFNNPRNVGTLDQNSIAVGYGIVGAMACGDVMVISIKVDKDSKIITEAKFKSFGCAANIAASSYTTELLIGKTLDEAENIKNLEISNYLELPEIKRHCSVLCEEAIKKAIEDYRKKNENTSS